MLDGHLLAQLVKVEQVGEVRAGRAPEAVIAPGTSIDVKQLVRAIAAVALVLQLDEAVVVDGFEEADGGRYQRRLGHGLDERACPAEVGRMLPKPAHRHAGERPPALEQAAVRELFLTAAWNHLLDDDLAL